MFLFYTISNIAYTCNPNLAGFQCLEREGARQAMGCNGVAMGLRWGCGGVAVGLQ